jgi:predicted DNA-binding transcriptional regulator YafY
VSEETFEVRVRIKHSIAGYFARRDLLPQQELVREENDGVTLLCKAAHQNQIIPLILFWLPNIEILEPEWLKKRSSTYCITTSLSIVTLFLFRNVMRSG